MARKTSFRTRRRRLRTWMRYAASLGNPRAWGFFRIRQQHVTAEEARFKKRSKRLTMADRLALMRKWAEDD